MFSNIVLGQNHLLGGIALPEWNRKVRNSANWYSEFTCIQFPNFHRALRAWLCWQWRSLTDFSMPSVPSIEYSLRAVSCAADVADVTGLTGWPVGVCLSISQNFKWFVNEYSLCVSADGMAIIVITWAKIVTVVKEMEINISLILYMWLWKLEGVMHIGCICC